MYVPLEHLSPTDFHPGVHSTPKRTWIMKELKVIAIKLKKKKDTDSYATYKTLHSTFDY